MRTKLVFEDGADRLEIVFPDGHMAQEFILRVAGTRSNKDAYRFFTREEILERTTRAFTIDKVIEEFNAGDDTTGRMLRDRAQIKRQRVVTHDPGSVAGSYWEGA